MPVLLIIAFLLACLPSYAQTPVARQRAAKTALQAELSLEGKDCPDAKTTYDANICLGDVLVRTRIDFNTFYENLSALLGPGDRRPLEDAQSQWVTYREKTCDAIDRFFRGGTIRPSATMRCEIELTRSRMRDLDSLYATVLHL